MKIQHYWETTDLHLNLVTNYGMETYGTAEDLGNGNYAIAFSPGKSGLFFFTVSFWGVQHRREVQGRAEEGAGRGLRSQVAGARQGR